MPRKIRFAAWKDALGEQPSTSIPYRSLDGSSRIADNVRIGCPAQCVAADTKGVRRSRVSARCDRDLGYRAQTAFEHMEVSNHASTESRWQHENRAA